MQFPFNESPREATLRVWTGFSHLVPVDPALLQDAIERNTGNPLIWSQAKADALRQAGGATRYPRIQFNDRANRPSMTAVIASPWRPNVAKPSMSPWPRRKKHRHYSDSQMIEPRGWSIPHCSRRSCCRRMRRRFRSACQRPQRSAVRINSQVTP